MTLGRWILLALACALPGAGAQSVTSLSPLPAPVAPAGNPSSQAKIDLGKVLFWDEQLSSTRTVACGTCHSPEAGGADRRWTGGFYYPGFHPGADQVFGTADDVNGSLGVPASNATGDYRPHATFGMGEQVTSRQTPAIFEAALAPILFADGRSGDALVDPTSGVTLLASGAALEAQALHPPVGSGEMAHAGRTWPDVVQRIRNSRPLALAEDVPTTLSDWIAARSYPALFAEAFGTPDVTPGRVAMAIATYERTLVPDETPFDVAIRGGAPLLPQEQRGYEVFVAASCAECHEGSRLTDDEFSYLGVRPATEDPGRFAVTGDPADLGAFRTPPLRNVALRLPYMHHGQHFSLEEVVEFYDRGGDFTAPNLDPRMVPLGLSATEKADLVAFLGRPLTDPRVVSRTPPFDVPRLYSRSSRQPTWFDGAQPGASGLTPTMVCLEPPLLGNPSFTVGVAGALAGVTAQLVVHDSPPGATAPAAPSFASRSITLDGQGFGSVSIGIPADPALRGTTLYARFYVDDGDAASDTYQLVLFAPPSACLSTCGDCDRSGGAPDVLDSLLAAQIASGLVAAAPGQEPCCDADGRGTIDILDSLRIARSATGLAAGLACP